MQLDLIDGLDLYERDYTKTNTLALKKATETWDKMYT